MNAIENFYVKNKVVVITGGAGLLGKKHAEAVIEGGGTVVLLDLVQERLDEVINELKKNYESCFIEGYVADITDFYALSQIHDAIIKKFGRIDVLINNAANNPKIEDKKLSSACFEEFSLKMWNDDLMVGLTGAFLCSQIFGRTMAEQRSGVILNISSDLGIIAPDQRIYKKPGLSEDEQVTKPVTYSVVKHGLIGLSKYLATYWAERGVRVNTICPAGVQNHQEPEFVEKLTNLIPMGRMASVEEYKSAILFMISDASSYMTGSTVIIDGGRTCW